MTNIEIRPIKAQETYPVRHAELRKGRPLSSCAFSGDEDATTIHLGAFAQQRLIGVASFMKAPLKTKTDELSMQLRGMAVLEAFHRQGMGALMLSFGENHLKTKQYTLIWMNARMKAVPFYTSLGYQVTGDEFMIPEVGPHLMMWKKL